MFAPLIPLITIFLVAFVLMLLGLVLSAKKPPIEIPELKATPRTSRRNSGYEMRSPRARRLLATYAVDDLPAFMADTHEKHIVLRSFERIPYWLRIFLLLILLFGGTLTLVLQTTFWNSTALPASWITMPGSVPTTTPADPTPLPEVLNTSSTATENLHRLPQMDPAQYNSESEFNTWAASACSAASMTVVINAYGNDYRITDVLNVATEQNAITPELGLLEPAGINRTVEQFGFRTIQLNRAPLDSLISVANNGWPIIIGFPPGVNWPGGHILVVVGGEGDKVFLADSSTYNLSSVTRDYFMQNWGGMALIVMPKDR